MKRYVLKLIAIGVAASVIVAAVVPPLQWRALILVYMATGQIDDLGWADLLRMLKPGSSYYLENLAKTKNPYTTIKNPFTAISDVKAGKVLYRSNCTACHGADGIGGAAPALAEANFKHGDSDWAMFRVVSRGVPGTQMAGMGLGEQRTWQVIAYLRSLKDLSKEGQADSTETKNLYVPPISYERLLNAESEPTNWLTYSGSYRSSRYSTLDQINRENVRHLQVRSVRQFPTSEDKFEVTPLVNHDLMYVTEKANVLHAIEVSSGRTVWTYERAIPSVAACCGLVNRGVAALDGLVFMGTIDAHLMAFDAVTGTVVWDTELADYRTGISITGAPLAVKDKVIVGVAGGEFGIRGFLDAYDAKTGERLWRFYTIPGPGEPGHETWGGDSWKTGGAPTWLTGSYDPDLNLLYWGVGNPAPAFQPETRPGDNLYSASVIALNADSGKLVWHFQFTPNDEHDWDAAQIPVLVDTDWKGKPRKLMLWANRNAFFYVLDRETGELLLSKPFSKQNWAREIDSSGRPVLIPETRVTTTGTVTWPGPAGATNWHSPSYNPQTGLMYVPVVMRGDVVFKRPNAIKHEPGRSFGGSGYDSMVGKKTFLTAVRAIDPRTGDVRWEHRHPPISQLWRWGGLVSTAGGIIFSGHDTRLFVLDAFSGKKLWDLDVGGRVNSSPITHAVADDQRLVIAAGRSLFSIGLPDARDLDTGPIGR